jgi:hypothetical protein
MDADGQTGFTSLVEGHWPLGQWKLGQTGSDVLELKRDSDRIWVMAGRQLVSRERVEVLTFGPPCASATRPPLCEIVEHLRSEQRPIILPWAPGKWWGARGRLLKDLFRNPIGLLVADSSLRPRGYPTPTLMRRAMALGIPLAAGSDPLCHPTEWRRIGSYVTRLTAAPPSTEVDWPSWLSSALLDRRVKRDLLGLRPGWLDTCLRVVRHMRSGRA